MRYQKKIKTIFLRVKKKANQSDIILCAETIEAASTFKYLGLIIDDA